MSIVLFRADTPTARGVVGSSPMGAIGTRICFPRRKWRDSGGVMRNYHSPQALLDQVVAHVGKSVVVPTNFVSHCAFRFPARMKIVLFSELTPRLLVAWSLRL